MIARLHQTIEAVCPIHGVSGSQGSVRIDYKPEATSQQQTDAQTALAAFDWSQAAHDLWLERRTNSAIGRTSAVRLQADRSTTSNSYQDVVGLSFQLEANKHYGFEFHGAYNTAGATTGIQLALNGPAQSFFAAIFEIATSTTAYLAAVSANYNSGVDGTASGGATNLPFHICGNLTTTASGLLIVRGRSETNGNTVTVKRGSYGLLFGVA